MPSPARRRLLIGGVVAATTGLAVLPVARRLARHRESVFVARNQRYDGQLVRTLHDGLLATGLDAARLRGRRVLLKPNLVEPTRAAPHVTTHPAVVGAAAEVFRSWGATVVVGEGPGHVRDTEMATVESGLQDVLDRLQLPFADLNYEEVAWVPNRGRASALEGFFFPRSVLEADLIVSLAKMKTHHWVGVTASLKNMYGVIPGIKYGWPKNVLHHNGIPETVFDINSSIPRTISIIDGITCMEGDGPIMGRPKPMGLIVVGTNPTAVDATVCRLMQVEPRAVNYLRLAADHLGPVDNQLIAQRGEAWRPLAARFEILDVPHLRGLRATL
ncbi:MAG: DUF362 domain-containing protein [Pirellulaceae bacterium]